MRYLVNTDGGSRGNPGPAGYGYVVRDETGTIVYERAGWLGTATNNVAEYMAVVDALTRIAETDPQAHVTVRADSKLVVQQLSGAWKIKNSDLQALALRAKRALPATQVTYAWVPRAENADADRLANLAMDERRDVERGRLGGTGATETGGPRGAGAEAPGDANDATQPSAPVKASPAPSHDGDPTVLVVVAVGAEPAAGVVGLVDRLLPGGRIPGTVWCGPGTATRATGADLGRALRCTPDALDARLDDVVAHARAAGGAVVVAQAELARHLVGHALGLDAVRLAYGAATVSVLRLGPDAVDVVALGVPTERDEEDLLLF